MLVKQWGWIGGGEVSDVCVDGREKGRKEGGARFISSLHTLVIGISFKPRLSWHAA